MNNVTVYTLDVDNYAPEIKELTFPWIIRYAKKIRARFHPITKRTRPECECMVEKFQIWELMAKHDDEYAIYIDADALIHPDLINIPEHLPRGHCLTYGRDVLDLRFEMDDYHRRDGRMIGCGNFISCVHRWARDYWLWPTDLAYSEIVSRIHPISFEELAGVQPKHLADDFITSRNVARFGLKFTTLKEIYDRLGFGEVPICHHHMLDRKAKREQILKIGRQWNMIPEDPNETPASTTNA